MASAQLLFAPLHFVSEWTKSASTTLQVSVAVVLSTGEWAKGNKISLCEGSRGPEVIVEWPFPLIVLDTLHCILLGDITMKSHHSKYIGFKKCLKILRATVI